MPELPEVEVTRRGLLAPLTDRTIDRISWSGQRLRRPIPGELLQAEIRGQRILTVDRRAKYLLLRMASGAILVIHLGMTGKIGLMARLTAAHRHDHLVLGLDNGIDLRFNDSRRFGAIIVWPAAAAIACEQAFSAREGLEPLGSEFRAKTLLRLAHNRRTPVKSLLMNGRLIAGIGNIYANELLFTAGIHPLTPAGEISARQWQRIITAARQVLETAITAGGSTISDFLGVSGHPGYFQLQFKVYGRKGLPCLCCAQPLVKTSLGGRATFHCPRCQPEP